MSIPNDLRRRSSDMEYRLRSQGLMTIFAFRDSDGGISAAGLNFKTPAEFYNHLETAPALVGRDCQVFIFNLTPTPQPGVPDDRVLN